MKYSKMLCWVRPHEKKELKEAVNGKFPLVFAKNYEDFKAQITGDAYLVLSLSKARFGLKRLQGLVRSFPNNMFNLYGLGNYEEITFSEFSIMDEENVVNGQYFANEISDNYLGIIPDLWEKRDTDSAHFHKDIDKALNLIQSVY